jgi:hypothetical protein
VTGSNLAMNRLIRQASGRSNVLTLLQPSSTTDVEPEVGRSSVGHGGPGLEGRGGPHDDLNEQIRTAANVVRGRLTIDDLINL